MDLTDVAAIEKNHIKRYTYFILFFVFAFLTIKVAK